MSDFYVSTISVNTVCHRKVGTLGARLRLSQFRVPGSEFDSRKSSTEDWGWVYLRRNLSISFLL